MKVGIAGAGGIGSNIAVHLLRSGFDDFMIVDFDRIEESNLNRQFYFHDQIGILKSDAIRENLLRICPDGAFKVVNAYLDEENINEIFSGAPIIAEAFDKKEAKAMLLTSVAERELIVSANGIAGDDLSSIETRRVTENLIIVGDFEKDIEEWPTHSTKVQLVATLMADIILKHIDRERGNGR